MATKLDRTPGPDDTCTECGKLFREVSPDCPKKIWDRHPLWLPQPMLPGMPSAKLTDSEARIVLVLAKGTEAIKAMELLTAENESYLSRKRAIDSGYAQQLTDLNASYMHRVSALIETATARMSDTDSYDDHTEYDEH